MLVQLRAGGDQAVDRDLHRDAGFRRVGRIDLKRAGGAAGDAAIGVEAEMVDREGDLGMGGIGRVAARGHP